jgi:DNA-binding NarL/FixJ family response regulator
LLPLGSIEPVTVNDELPLRTLIVEPQALIAKALRSFLGHHPSVCVVGDAPAVRRDEVLALRPHLIVYGLENCAHEVRDALAIARSAQPGVRLCVLSSYANRDLMNRSFAAGATGFIVKDSSPRELDDALRALAAGASYVDPRVADRAGRRSAERGSPLGKLTAREGEILSLIAGGHSNREISARLRIVEKTVKNHVSRILSKLNVHRRTQAAVYALHAGIAPTAAAERRVR